jgi:type III pantothenate kinase
MVLTVDIGNTNIVLGAFSGDDLRFVARIATNAAKTEDEYATKIRSILYLHEIEKTQIDGAVISSVVPPLTRVMKEAVKMVYGVDAITVGPGVKSGINIRCDDPSTVGADLICACVAANSIYGNPSLVIDMGTATKMMVIDSTGTFIGASIIPGVNIALKALSSGTAQLPQISLEAPRSVIGKNTSDCMRSGAVFGNAAMLDGMIDRFNDEMGCSLKLIATGGLSSTIVKHCKHNIIQDDDLVLKGLNIIYHKHAK